MSNSVVILRLRLGFCELDIKALARPFPNYVIEAHGIEAEFEPVARKRLRKAWHATPML
jgi:hypothetical protein